LPYRFTCGGRRIAGSEAADHSRSRIVGYIDAIGRRIDSLVVGTRVGIPWLGRTCGQCTYCHSGREISAITHYLHA
jgi:threonine dehydrogenase-like Zn-dependent dehydrogenase